MGKIWNQTEFTKKALSNYRKHLQLKPMLGKKFSKKTKMKMSVARKKAWKEGKYTIKSGWHHSEKTKVKLSNQKIGKSSPRKGVKLSNESREKIRTARLKQKIPTKDTKPERMLQIALMLNNIKFEKHYPIMGQPDIYISEKRICIFVDGDYWHTRPEQILRDFRVNYDLNKKRYHVIRVWEHDIYDNVQEIAENIIWLINSCSCSWLHGRFCCLKQLT